MVYKNYSGQITIDEAVALSDVAKEAEVISILQNAKAKLQELITEAHQYKGQTMTAIIDVAENKIRQIDNLISNLEDTQIYTKNVVAHYQVIDQQCRTMIESL